MPELVDTTPSHTELLIIYYAAIQYILLIMHNGHFASKRGHHASTEVSTPGPWVYSAFLGVWR